jgi:hypothetical protein
MGLEKPQEKATEKATIEARENVSPPRKRKRGPAPISEEYVIEEDEILSSSAFLRIQHIVFNLSTPAPSVLWLRRIKEL